MKRNEVLEKLDAKMTLANYSLDTVKAYKNVLNKFCVFLLKFPKVREMEHNKRIESYLSWRVKKFDISPSTQNVEFNALIYFHRKILEVEVNNINSLRARPKVRIPPILTVEQVSALLDELPGTMRLIGRMLYGNGLRLNECLRLRLKDIDFSNGKIVIHEGKGDKEGIAPLPDSLRGEIREQMELSALTWELDHKNGYGVNLPRAMEKKYQSLGMSQDWYWLFPHTETAIDPRSKRRQRHHVYDFDVQSAFREARRKLKLPEYATPHALRHAFATHLAQDMLSRGFPQDMVEAEIVKYLRHANRETLKFYVHLAAPKDTVVRLPIENL